LRIGTRDGRTAPAHKAQQTADDYCTVQKYWEDRESRATAPALVGLAGEDHPYSTATNKRTNEQTTRRSTWTRPRRTSLVCLTEPFQSGTIERSGTNCKLVQFLIKLKGGSLRRENGIHLTSLLLYLLSAIISLQTSRQTLRQTLRTSTALD
jgi:hypothetical protein